MESSVENNEQPLPKSNDNEPVKNESILFIDGNKDD